MCVHVLQVTSPSHWILHISYNVSSTPNSLPPSFSLVHGDIEVPFVLHNASMRPSKSPPTSFHSNSGSSSDVQTVHFVLTSAVLVLVVCLLALIMVVCASHGKSRLKAKVSNTKAKLTNTRHVSHRQPVASALAPERAKKRQESKSNLQRSSSTTGWPTAERRLQRRRKKGLEYIVRRCHSLPALLPVSTLAYASNSPLVSRRVNLNKVHTRIKRLAKLDYSELYSNSKKKTVVSSMPEPTSAEQAQDGNNKKRTCTSKEGPGGVAQLVQSVGVETCSRNTGPSQKPGVGVASYAVFLVHSLATSARTPEPGSHPTSRV